MKTDSDALGALYDALANKFTEILKDGRQVVDKTTGEVVTVDPDAATLNAIRQFLKDSNITVVPGAHKPTNDLVDALPFGGDEHSPEYAH